VELGFPSAGDPLIKSTRAGLLNKQTSKISPNRGGVRDLCGGGGGGGHYKA
jgi:hypothetical protein